MNMGFSAFKQERDQAVEQHCQPESYCTWNSSNRSCGCKLKTGDPAYNECQNACSNWAGKSIDCPGHDRFRDSYGRLLRIRREAADGLRGQRSASADGYLPDP